MYTLIVDDDPDALRILNMILNHLEWETHVVSVGAKALWCIGQALQTTNLPVIVLSAVLQLTEKRGRQ